jgi:hypothetical protein
MRKTRDNPELIARTCEEILISLGRSVEAYERDAITANRGTSYAAGIPGDRREASGLGGGRADSNFRDASPLYI